MPKLHYQGCLVIFPVSITAIIPVYSAQAQRSLRLMDIPRWSIAPGSSSSSYFLYVQNFHDCFLNHDKRLNWTFSKHNNTGQLMISLQYYTIYTSPFDQKKVMVNDMCLWDKYSYTGSMFSWPAIITLFFITIIQWLQKNEKVTDKRFYTWLKYAIRIENYSHLITSFSFEDVSMFLD